MCARTGCSRLVLAPKAKGIKGLAFSICLSDEMQQPRRRGRSCDCHRFETPDLCHCNVHLLGVCQGYPGVSTAAIQRAFCCNDVP
ncbi:hypothetical protein E2P81_ATG07938 [Venturia nashicola]|nr:hypothetical protein E2P81_ATG07938 [Venturia nashicola]